MDHLEQAKRDAAKADKVEPYATCAIAHALIALVERLDKLTDTDGLDKTRGYLRCDVGQVSGPV